jgi:hypothetical protein
MQYQIILHLTTDFLSEAVFYDHEWGYKCLIKIDIYRGLCVANIQPLFWKLWDEIFKTLILLAELSSYIRVCNLTNTHLCTLSFLLHKNT